MTLQKVREPIFKSTDPHFNHEAARWAYDLVMKMDEDTAQEFVFQVVSDVLEETIEKNERTLQRHLDKVIAKRMNSVKRALLAKSAANPEAVPYAQALKLISKANAYDYGYKFRESDFNRDPSTGQFRSKIKHNPRSYQRLNGKQAAAMGIPTHPMNNDTSFKAEHKAQFQDEYRQLAAFLGAAAQSSDDSDVLLHLRNKATGQTYTTLNNGTRPDATKWDPRSEELIGVTAKPRGLTYGGAAFGLTSALGASTDTGGRSAYAVNQLHTTMNNGFADDWTKDGDLQNSNERLYRRMKSGSQMVGGMAPPGSKVAVAAKFGEFVGEHGPQAEQVIGPAARKTAYRYRGTEKKPESDVVHQYGVAIRNAKTRSVLGDNPSAQQIANARSKVVGRAPTWDERGAGRAVLRDHLWDQERRPKGELYNLQLASGNTPPSEGFIINAKGQIATQAIGYGDDHYLPFNLKNLKQLKGGEYIRTRSVGGPTSEDIYTGLISGARQITVVSRSGTFTVEFEPDFRGGRRHNDKARRMVRRYEQILDAVQSEQVDRKSVDPAIRNGIVAQVREEAAISGISPMAQARLVNERIEEFKSSPELTEKDEKLVDVLWRYQTRNGEEPDSERIRRQIENQVAAEKEYKFRLNGVGYAGALDALREQFPYYIKVNSVPTREPERSELGLDYGYVEPGKNRPTAANAGLFGATHRAKFEGKKGKFSAAEADYQKRGTFKPVDTPKTEVEGEVDENGKKKDPKKSPAQVVAEAAQKRRYEEAAVNIQKEMQKVLDRKDISAADQRVLDAPPAELSRPENQAQFNDLATAYARRVNTDAARAYLAAAGHLERTPFDAAAAGAWTEKPHTFAEEAYQANAPEDVRKKEVQRINDESKSGIVYPKPLTSMTDVELRGELAALGVVSDIARSGELSLSEKGELLNQSSMVTLAPNAPGMRGLLEAPDLIPKRMELIQRARALNADVPEDKRAAESASRDPGTITIGNPPETGNQRREDARNRVLNNVQRAEMLARHLENDPEGDEVVVRRLRKLADIGHQALNNGDIHNDAEADAWISRNAEGLRFLSNQEIEAVERRKNRS